LVTGRKLLLADDSVTIQKVIDLTFSDEGIEVTTVSNGELALSKLEEIQPDIVLADIFMPGRNGYEVCEHIKRDARYRHIPVLLLVGSFEPFDEAEARRVGADDYLTKPFQSIRQLVSKVASLLGGSSQAGDEASTRDLELPEELSKQQGRENGSADIYTADTAPLPTELANKEPAEAVAHLAGHESLDDELIETRPATEIAEPRLTMSAGDTRPTEPLSFADLAEAGIKSPAQAEPELQSQPESFNETIRDFKLEEMNEEVLSTEPQQRPARASYMNNAAAADEALLDLGDIEPPVSMTEADDFILDLQDEAPAAVASMTEPARAAATWPETETPILETDGADGADDFAPPVEAGTSAHGFVEDTAPAAYENAEASNSYPAAEAGAIEHFATAEAGVGEAPAVGEAAPTAFAAQGGFEPQVEAHGLYESTFTAMPERVFSEETPTVEAAPPFAQSTAMPAAQPSGQITLDQLSPEAIDAIARRAVELLSSKVVEQVAWEVVPQLAELLIKRKLEEEKAQ
jgi:CheY-like chemotaxis protein